MMVVRHSFTAKPGQASKLAAMFKEAGPTILGKHRVLTDVTGEFNRVVLEFEVENLAEFEAVQQRYATDPSLREKLAGYTDLWTTGSREILQVVK